MKLQPERCGGCSTWIEGESYPGRDRVTRVTLTDRRDGIQRLHDLDRCQSILWWRTAPRWKRELVLFGVAFEQRFHATRDWISACRRRLHTLGVHRPRPRPRS